MKPIPDYLLPKNLQSSNGSLDPFFVLDKALSDSEKHRLVKASKSPTTDKKMDLEQKKNNLLLDQQRLRHNHQWMLKTGETSAPVIVEHEPRKQHTPLNSPACTTIQKEVKMYCRGWTNNNGQRIEGHSEGLPYFWVVEVPKK